MIEKAHRFHEIAFTVKLAFMCPSLIVDIRFCKRQQPVSIEKFIPNCDTLMRQVGQADTSCTLVLQQVDNSAQEESIIEPTKVYYWLKIDVSVNRSIFIM